jgi:hypothetical protein
MGNFTIYTGTQYCEVSETQKGYVGLEMQLDWR